MIGAGVPDASNGGTPQFALPWQAHAFAMVLKLHEAGLFSWPEWTATLARRIAAAQAAGAPDQGDTYYVHWLAALEEMVAHKGAATAEELRATACAWDNAAHRTPHGTAITLRDEDFLTPS